MNSSNSDTTRPIEAAEVATGAEALILLATASLPPDSLPRDYVSPSLIREDDLSAIASLIDASTVAALVGA